MSPAPTVAISYSRADTAAVGQLHAELEAAGLSVWRDVTDLDASRHFRGDIADAISSCRVLLVAISRNSQASGEVMSEVELAKEERKPILPVYLEPLDEPLEGRLRYVLAGVDHVELFRDFDGGIQRILSSIGQLPGAVGGRDDVDFAALERLSGEELADLIRDAEAKVRSGRGGLTTLLLLGRCRLRLAQHREAQRWLEKAARLDGSSADALYLLAIAVLGGHRPRALTATDAARLERLLLRASELDPDRGRYALLAAVIAADYYEGHGLAVPPPPVEELIATWTRRGVSEADRRELVSSVAVDPAVAERVRLRHETRRVG